MNKDEDFKLLKIQTCVLRVNIHCDGCKQKVKKLLQRIEGVYQVNIDAEQQKVTISGSVDSASLIKKLVRAGKHAELWSNKTSPAPKLKANCIKDDKDSKNKKQGDVKPFKNQQKFQSLISEEDDDYFDDEEEDDDEDDELRFIREKANQLGLLRQQAITANNAKMNNNGGKKGTPNQNMGMKGNNGGIDQKTMAAMKMNNALLGGGGNINPGEVKRGNDLNSMFALAGLQGNGGAHNNISSAAGTGLGGNPNGMGAFQAQARAQAQAQVQAQAQAQAQQNNGFNLGSSTGYPNGLGHYPSTMMMNMNGFQNNPSSMMMNLQNRQAIPQPQMMYHRSPLIPPSTGYYYNNYGPHLCTYNEPNYNGDHHSNNSATHMFSDENTSGCSIM